MDQEYLCSELCVDGSGTRQHYCFHLIGEQMKIGLNKHSKPYREVVADPGVKYRLMSSKVQPDNPQIVSCGFDRHGATVW